MRKIPLIVAAILLCCSSIFLFGFKSGSSEVNVKTTKAAKIQSTERPLEIIIQHLNEGKRVKIASVHNSAAGNRLTFVFPDGSRMLLTFAKMVTAGNHQIIDRRSELQVTYYPVGGYPVTMMGFVTIYSLKPLTGRVVELYDAHHELHMSSSSIFAF